MTIANGDLPVRPDDGEEPTMFEHLWELSRLCWKEPNLRPTAQQLVERLTAEIDIGELM